MPDFLSPEFREIFAGYEQGEGLNEGSILKAIQKLDAEIKRDEDLQASRDLEFAANPNLNPEIAAKYARHAGLQIDSGDRVKEAKPFMQRMAKTYIDPKLSAEAREESLQKDREELEGLYFRSAEQGGQRGVAVTGQRPTGPARQDQFFPDVGGGVASESLEESAKLLGVTPGYVPTPRSRTPQQGTEDFIQTLEPERTRWQGTRGQREIAEIRQRNKIRIAQWQAGQPKPVALGETQQLFEVSPGKAKLLTAGRGRPGDLKERKLKVEETRVKLSEKKLILSEKRLNQAEDRLKAESKGKGIKQTTVKFFIDNINKTLGERDSVTNFLTGEFTPEAVRTGWKRMIGLALGMPKESGVSIAKSLRSLMGAPPPEILAAFPEYFPGMTETQVQETPEQIREDFIAEGKTAEAKEKARKRLEAIGFTGQ